MKKVGDFIVKYKYIILIVFVAILVASAIMTMFVKVNPDITAYLPTESATSKGQNFLRSNFNIDGDLIAVIDIGGKHTDEVALKKGITRVKPKIDEIKKIKKVTGASWMGDEIFNTFAGTELGAILEEALKNSLIMEDNFIVMITLEVSSSSQAAFDIMDECAKILEDETVAFGGSTASSKIVSDETLASMPLFVGIAIAVVFLILLLTTESIFEPFLLLASIGVAILINMGTDIIWKDISVITQACSSVLQIGLTMDFAIFLMHSYHSELDKMQSPEDAIRIAVPKTMATISASALTTIGGFVALAFMRMTFGLDLAKVLIKGIIISLITICLLQPVLILLCKKLLRKGRHPFIHYTFKRPAKLAVKAKAFLIVCFVAVLGVSFWGQLKVDYTYMDFETSNTNLTKQEEVVASMNNQIILCIPTKDMDVHYAFLDDLKNVNNVNSVMGLYAIVPKRYSSFLNNDQLAGLVKQLSNNGYAMYTVSLSTIPETLQGDITLERVHATLGKFFEKDYYITGTTQAIADLKEITPADLTLVTIISTALIAVILLFSLKSFLRTLGVLSVILAGIWINISINSFSGTKLNFITIIAINAIQLGATIDYAILMSSKYMERRRNGMNKKPSARLAMRETSMSICTSASILIAACLSVSLVSKNIIVSEITSLIARGAFISSLLVLFILPGILIVTDVLKPKQKTIDYETYSEKKHKEEKKDKKQKSKAVFSEIYGWNETVTDITSNEVGAWEESLSVLQTNIATTIATDASPQNAEMIAPETTPKQTQKGKKKEI